MAEIISTADAPQAIGPYSQAIKHNGLVFISGQIPLDPASGELVGDSGSGRQWSG
jgi:2-iminobutanoate/2-iminopropanoate deaminase